MDVNPYLTFHMIVETFSIIVSFSIFGVGYYTYNQSQNKYALFLSCAFLAIGLVDIMHMLSFPNMPAFITPNSTNKGILFWISARLISALALIMSVYIYADTAKRWISKKYLLPAVLIISTLIFVLAIFYPLNLPQMFIEGSGLTTSKIFLEWALIVMFACASILYWKRFLKTGENFIILILAALIISIFGELSFTLYKSAFDTYNMLGHIYKLMAFIMIYASIFYLTISKPYQKLEKEILEREKAEEEIKLASLYNRSLIEVSLDPLVTIGRDGKVTDVNIATEKITGFSRDEIVGTDFSSYFTEPDKAKTGYEKVFSQGFVKDYPLEIQHKDGHITPVIYNASVYHDEYGEVIGVFAAARDITELKKVEKELSFSESRLKHILEGSPIPKFVINKEHEIIHWNKALEGISNISSNEVIGTRNQWKAFYDKERPCLADLLVDGATEKIPEWYEGKYDNSKFLKEAYEAVDFFPALGENGKWLFFTAAPIKDSEDNLIGAMETLEDITERKKAEIALKKSEERFRAVAESAVDALVTTDINGTIRFFNNSLSKIFGYSKEELTNKPLTNLMPERYKDKYLKELERFKESGEHSLVGKTVVTTGLKRDGTEFPFEMSLSSWKSGEKIFFTSIIRDLTEKDKAEEALRESEEKYRTIIETAQEGMWVIDENAKTTYVNPSMAEILGYSADEMMGKSLFDFMDDDGKVDASEKMERRRSGIREVHDFRFIHKDGSEVWTMISTNPIFDKNEEFIGALGMLSDITHRKQMEVQIKKSLEEKEMLLKEIHHRVKNNLAVISSLLNLQSEYITNKEDLELFRESQTRAKSMALIHEKLYQSEDLKRINFGEYMQTLVKDLFNIYAVDSSYLTLHMDVENIMLDINLSIPLGLIINELISNCLKYAFPNGRKGKINIKLESKDSKITLIVGDNGVGMPEDIDFKNTDSLGLQLVNNLVGQIDGEIKLDRSHGTEFEIKFKELEYK